MPAVAGDAITQPVSAFRILVFSKTAGFRHSSIAPGVEAIKQLGIVNGFGVDATEDAAAFDAATLAAYSAVVFLSTTGDVLAPEQQAAFEDYIRGGGGFVGIHSATDTEYDWAWYGGLVGAYFLRHPAPQDATIVVEDQTHESTSHLGPTWDRFDEWYDFRDNPRGRVHILLSLDVSTVEGSEMGSDHPMAWCHEYEGGRAWYTALGHTDESWSEPAFVQHVLGGFRTAVGVDVADCSTPAVSVTSIPASALPAAGHPSQSSAPALASPASTTTTADEPAPTNDDNSTSRWVGASILVGVVALAGIAAVVIRRRHPAG